MKASTGLRLKMLSATGNSFPNVMTAFTLKIYSGAEPSSADGAIATTNILLCEVFNGNDGLTRLTFNDEPVIITASTPTTVNLSKNVAETWEGTVSTNGTSSFFRLELAADDQSQSQTHQRVQGSIGLAGADVNLATLVMTSGASQLINYFTVSFPTL